jgi:hypothetical protein
MFLTFGQTPLLHTMLQSVVYHSSTASHNERPYERQTAPYKKQQFDNSKEPGEQTLKVGGLEANHLFIVVLVLLSLTLLLVKKLITVSVHHKVLTCGTKVK